MEQQYPSKLLEKAVTEFASLPGIGRKTALRLVLHLLRQPTDDVQAFAKAVSTVKQDIKYCRVCHNISDTEVCPICSSLHRDTSLICVVENIQDVMAIENTQQYNGLYRDRFFNRKGAQRRHKRSNSGAEFDDGRRHNQLLYIAETGRIRCEAECDCTRNIRGRRTGIYRRGNFGTRHCEQNGGNEQITSMLWNE